MKNSRWSSRSWICTPPCIPLVSLKYISKYLNFKKKKISNINPLEKAMAINLIAVKSYSFSNGFILLCALIRFPYFQARNCYCRNIHFQIRKCQC